MTFELPRSPVLRTALLVLGVFFWLSWSAGLRPLTLPDEGRYVGVAWEMLRSGDWLTPTLNGLPYFHKPPLFYWITASSLWALGSHEWAARLASLLGATLAVVSLTLFVRRWVGARAARLSLVAVVVQPMVLFGAQFANLDMLVAGAISATIVLLAHAALSMEAGMPYRAPLAGAYAMAAVAVLAKGLIGFVIPGMVVTVWLLIGWRWRTLWALLWWPGVLIFLAIGAPWFFAMQLRFPDFFHYFFVVQHFQRFASGGFNNAMPIWFYPAVLALACWPWLPWLAGLLRRNAEGVRYLGAGPQRSVRQLMVVWVVMVVLFFSLPASKLIGYVLPAMPPLAFLLAEGFAWRASGRPSERWLWRLAAVVGVVMVVGLVAYLVRKPAHSASQLGAVLQSSRQAGEPVIMVGGYVFDLPFYAHLQAPVVVVDQWDDPNLRMEDSQRKELADAGVFLPAAAAQRLRLPGALPELLCPSVPGKAAVAWLVGPAKPAAPYDFLQPGDGVDRVAVAGKRALWRLETRRPAVLKALACPE